jgi:broad specificity phosphatase PhoE
MNARGVAQVDAMVEELARELATTVLDCVYCGPDQASRDTAESLSIAYGTKVKIADRFCNLNVGLWQGKLIGDIKSQQPKVYRRWQGQPETVCPPEGEMVAVAQKRIRDMLVRIGKRHRDSCVAIVVPEPLASLLQSELTQTALVDLWQAECKGSRWEIVNVPHTLVPS